MLQIFYLTTVKTINHIFRALPKNCKITNSFSSKIATKKCFIWTTWKMFLSLYVFSYMDIKKLDLHLVGQVFMWQFSVYMD